MVFGDHGTHDVITIPIIQLIIGGYKYNDILCGSEGGHSLNMKGLCQDFNTPPADGDNTYNSSVLECEYISINDIFGQTKEHIEQYSFLPINTHFINISFGGCPRGVYGGTRGEILHDILLELCDYIAEGTELTFTQPNLHLTSHVVVGINKDSRRQNKRHTPNLGLF